MTTAHDELHVLWHDIECGRYAQDLPLWRELAAQAGGPILDLGAGSGRVALDLARAGHEVVALDLDRALLAALDERAAGSGLAAAPAAGRAAPAAGRAAAGADRAGSVSTVRADARDFALGRRFALVLAPMQTVQLLGGPDGRAGLLRCAAAHLTPDGLLACALADALEGFDGEHAGLPLPDLLERDGWLYASQPVAVRPDAEGTTIERIRQTVSPDGARTAEGDAVRLDRLDAERLEAEGVAAGLRPAGRRFVEMTDEHVGSEVVLMACGAEGGDA